MEDGKKTQQEFHGLILTYNPQPSGQPIARPHVGARISEAREHRPTRHRLAQLLLLALGACCAKLRAQAAVDYYGPIDIVMMMPDVTTPPGSGFDHDAPTSPESRLLGTALLADGFE